MVESELVLHLAQPAAADTYPSHEGGCSQQHRYAYDYGNTETTLRKLACPFPVECGSE